MKEKMFLQMILSILLQVFGFIVGFFKSKIIPVSLMGVLFFASNVNGIIFIFVDLGITSIHYQYSGKDNFNKYFSSYLALKMFLISTNFILAMIWLSFLNYDALTKSLITIFFWNSLLVFCTEIFNTNLQIKLKIIKKEVSKFIIQFLSYFIQLYLVFNFDNYSNTLLLIVYVILFMNLVNFFVIILLSIKEIQLNTPNWSFIREYLRDSKPLILQSIFSILSSYIGGIMIGSFYGYEELAYYTFIMAYIVNIFITASITISNLFDAIYPKLFEMKKHSDIMSINQLFEKYASLFFIFLIIWVNITFEIILELLLPNYLPSMKYLRILIFIPYLDAIIRPYSGNLIQNKQQKLSAIIAILHLILSLIMQIVIISKEFLSIPMLGWGTWGLIFIQIFFGIENNIVVRYISKKKCDIVSNVHHVKHLLMGIITFAIVYLADRYFISSIINNYYQIIIITLISSGIYLFLLFVSKELNMVDIRYLKELFMVKEYLNSLKNEL